MTVNIRDRFWNIERTDPDLTGVIERATTHPVSRIDVWPNTPGGATVAVAWKDGACCICSMPDPGGALAWAHFTCPGGVTVHGGGGYVSIHGAGA